MRQLLVGLVIAAASLSAAHAQTSDGTNRVVSPSVVASWQGRTNADGTGSLVLLVLWRGSPGWFMRGTSSSGGGGATGGFDKWTASQWMSYGDITLTMELNSDSKDFPPETTTVTIVGREIALRDTNVVLVDDVDTASPAIVGTRFVEPNFVGNDPVPPVVKRSPELFEFLRCEAATGRVFEALCRQMRP